ncbi:MAG: hypothetical protein JRJ56_01980 [Deltaproteobacteria bacterium]|nr:hypothetical protein [Deltaproteobacteria bacterium]
MLLQETDWVLLAVAIPGEDNPAAGQDLNHHGALGSGWGNCLAKRGCAGMWRNEKMTPKKHGGLQDNAVPPDHHHVWITP